ncbi:uncharacterized protein HMPREF1541_05431 [Cyphellophora europaea CBS 101466]|uniref:MOSC domain-containing protein n=1 Tax=Cyphellophora europaea (strain CBS 101466) TaxID=1220924 RepID=W2RTW5_CYPE1|nr:uncharacterized protein HMPREF1541_05431 [Cyphellophora europaea CBS 101466]ETN39208.1 hypothetical protein HMPREF1541_05431 [Cyphellophora europaea CBS 101466]
MTVSEITDLRIYPIKSCRGLSIPAAQLTTSGLHLDRQWMFVDGDHKFLTIRQKPQMTLINTSIDHEKQLLVITIGSDTSKQISVPLYATDAWLAENAKPIIVNIWEYDTEAYMYTDPTIQSLFRDFIGDGSDVFFVVKDPKAPRICRGNGAPDILGRKATVNFPDVLPLQIASESSLAELNGRLKGQGHDEITVERFRPNIIIKGGEPWSEDSWKTVRINGSGAMGANWLPSAVAGPAMGAIDIDVAARCARCQVPNVNPDTAEKDKHQPWDTLMKYRRVDEGITFKPCFGMLCVPRNEGKVEVGMRFEVLGTTQDHKYIKGF